LTVCCFRGYAYTEFNIIDLADKHQIATAANLTSENSLCSSAATL